jgi:ribosomal protein S18 acetylase RimI-like enzyme
MSDEIIELLTRSHDRKHFDSGQESLNDFIRKYAGQNMRHRFTVTYVLVKRGEIDILAYYSLSAGQFRREDAPEEVLKHIPKYPVPVVRLGRLAVDLRCRGMGYGGKMLNDVITRSIALSATLGIHSIEVDALNPSAGSFYKKYGFKSLKDDPSHLYLPIETAIKALK